MPAAPFVSAKKLWRESWPPAQIRLESAAVTGSTSEYDPSITEQIDSDDKSHVHDDSPLIHFLSPTPPLLSVNDKGESYFDDDSDSSSCYFDNNSDDEDGTFYSSAMDIGLDAGIEGAAHSQPIVRNVSPSSLADSVGRAGHYASLNTRPPAATTSAKRLLQLQSKNSFGRAGSKDGDYYIDSARAADYKSRPAQATRSESRPVSSQPRFLPVNDLDAFRLSDIIARNSTKIAATTLRRRSPRSWRAPSLNVFSIEEEEEIEDRLSTGATPNDRQGRSRSIRHNSDQYCHFLAENTERDTRKPHKIKQVRFILPTEKKT